MRAPDHNTPDHDTPDDTPDCLTGELTVAFGGGADTGSA